MNPAVDLLPPCKTSFSESMLLTDGTSLTEDRCFAEHIAQDVAAFGADAAHALSELPEKIARLNRTYRHLVAHRSLLTLPQIQAWIGQSANVFLRHDAVFVFAIHHQTQVGMANFVEMSDADFVVDERGRRQTLQKAGTLPNLSTVHAFVSGRLSRVQNEAPPIDLTTWYPVLYRPDRGPHFLAADRPGEFPDNALPDFQPVISSPRVLMTPGRIKVWCEKPLEQSGASVVARPRGESP